MITFCNVLVIVLFLFKCLDKADRAHSVSQSCLSLCNHMDCGPPGFSVHGIFQMRSTGVHCHFLLQRIFPTQGSNLYVLHPLYWWADSLPLSHLHVGLLAKLLQSCLDSLQPYGPAWLLRPWDFPGKTTGVVARPSSRGSSGKLKIYHR